MVLGARELHPELVASHAVDRDRGDLTLGHFEAEPAKQVDGPIVVRSYDEPDARQPKRLKPEREVCGRRPDSCLPVSLGNTAAACKFRRAGGP